MNTGGPAFPADRVYKNEWQDDMTLRDYFAAKAMEAVIANAMCSEKDAVFYDEVSAISYEMADAMLKARDQ